MLRPRPVHNRMGGSITRDPQATLNGRPSQVTPSGRGPSGLRAARPPDRQRETADGLAGPGGDELAELVRPLGRAPESSAEDRGCQASTQLPSRCQTE